MSKLLASWLVVLIVLPFTAPFPTCDASDLFGLTQQRQRTTAEMPSHSSTTLDDSSTLFPPAATVREQTRLILIAHASAPSGVGITVWRAPVASSRFTRIARQRPTSAVLRV